MNVSKIDLNLFVVFDAVYTTRNLTRASEILCITQPAVSNEARDPPREPEISRSQCRKEVSVAELYSRDSQ